MILFKILILLFSSSIFLTLYAEDIEDTLIKERELEAEEDPLAKQQIIMLENQKEENPFSYILYTSIRDRYRYVSNDQPVWEDYGSRFGINSWYELVSQTWVFARYEAGFNLLKELGIDLNTDYDTFKSGETLYTRLSYIGFQENTNIILYGKNWSAYYQVAGFTDRFDSLGGEGSGVYNARTDGGASGLGRADDVLQTRFSFESIEFNLQAQSKQDIPYIENIQYKYGLGMSVIINPYNNFKVGAAYSYSAIDLNTISLANKHSLNGDMMAYLLGVQWYSQNWYLGATFSKNYNLQTTDNENYIDSSGLEIYTQYQLLSDIWLLGGYNYSKPDSNELDGEDYLLSYGVLGLRYTVDEFSKMFYIEVKLDQGKTSKYTQSNNQVVVGIRWSLEYANF